jgi:hypothetical protein
LILWHAVPGALSKDKRPALLKGWVKGLQFNDRQPCFIDLLNTLSQRGIGQGILHVSGKAPHWYRAMATLPCFFFSNRPMLLKMFNKNPACQARSRNAASIIILAN